MENTEKRNKIHIRGTKFVPDRRNPPIPLAQQRKRNWNDDSRIKEGYEKKKIPIAYDAYGNPTFKDEDQTPERVRLHIECIAEQIRKTPFKNWSPDLMKEAQEHFTSDQVALFVREQEAKKRKQRK